ncbi:MAG: hypothetical protein GY729_05630 [Desulfobacteraceae bacterium]|nr:hypothetical protein [Desulfobacteraceae bacterium]
MISDEKLLRSADLNDLKETLGVSMIDIIHLMGSMNFKLTGAKGQQLIGHPANSLLIRYLNKYPEDYFIPEMPESEEVYDVVSQHYNGKLSHSKFGVLFGNASWAGCAWNNGDSPSVAVKRLFYLLLNAIESEGSNGLKKFLELVDTEARLRGLGGLEQVTQKGNWNTQKFKEMAKKEAEAILAKEKQEDALKK